MSARRDVTAAATPRPIGRNWGNDGAITALAAVLVTVTVAVGLDPRGTPALGQSAATGTSATTFRIQPLQPAPAIRAASGGTATMRSTAQTVGGSNPVAAASNAAASPPVDPQVAAIAAKYDPLASYARSGSSELPDPFSPPVGAPDPVTEQRLAKINQRTFDRRPSVILRAKIEPMIRNNGSDVPTSSASRSGSAADKATLTQVLASKMIVRGDVVIEADDLDALATTQAAASNAAGSEQPADAAVPDPFDKELDALEREVTLGQWQAARNRLAGFPPRLAMAAYDRMIQTLQTPRESRMMPVMVPVEEEGVDRFFFGPRFTQQTYEFGERNLFTLADLLGLLQATPGDFKRDQVEPLGAIVRQGLDGGLVTEELVTRLRQEIDRDPATAKRVMEAADRVREAERRTDSQDKANTQTRAKTVPMGLTARWVCRILDAADLDVELEPFLPSLDQAREADDREAFNLWAKLGLARFAQTGRIVDLEAAWEATQSALAVGEIADDQKADALTRAVDLATKVREELGRSWLVESFTKRPERGREILVAIGRGVAQALLSEEASDPDARLKRLELQKKAVEILLESAPNQADQWGDTLDLLAAGWLREAEFSRRFDRTRGAAAPMKRDRFGNFYYSDDDDPMTAMLGGNSQLPRPIPVDRLLDQAPDSHWLAFVEPGVRPRYARILAQLHLKFAEEDKAFPYIERLAATHPDQARGLAEEFLVVWTKNHKLNVAPEQERNPYVFIFGFEQRASGIPLTRSKQERNLKELAEYVGRLRALEGLGDLDERLLTEAFTACHSPAEVYRIETIETVFGPFDQLKPRTLSAFAQSMRANLTGLWRNPAVQKTQKTNRKLQDIKAEVARGYQVARAVLDRAAQVHPDDWSIALATAALAHDELEFRREVAVSSDDVPQRLAIFDRFARAAQLYTRDAAHRAENDESLDPFQIWFYASLGACDLGRITEEMVADPNQPARIKATLEAMPAEVAERHRARFASDLFARMGAVNPAVKFRYLKSAFQIIGDHEHAREARRILDYYNDLVTEIRLETHLDGESSNVGTDRPFGLFVTLRHTREIEREAGGFAKYLQNQNNGMMFYYNYGRPLENYRDKFTEAAKKALEDQFEVVSVTFQAEDAAGSRATAEDGWRVTPYAYLLLKPRGPQVDRVPPLKLDLDFLDTSGYVVLPIESPPLAIDARGKSPARGLPEKLAITQTLDERQAKQGRLILEVKAVARGLVPEFDALLDLRPDGFRITSNDDQGVSVVSFDNEADTIAVTTERLWTITLEAQPSQAAPPKEFRFATPRFETIDMTYQRYNDADLVKVEPIVSLEQRYGQPDRTWMWAVPLGMVTVLGGLAVLVRLTRRDDAHSFDDVMALPATLGPFNTLTLLKALRDRPHWTPDQTRALEAEIEALEQRYFAESADPTPNAELRARAAHWLRRAGVEVVEEGNVAA